MTPIEELVRQALGETPTTTTTTDPLAALDRRVRKARRWLAAGAGAVAAAVVTAVVVPLAVLSGGNDAANKVIVGNTPTPAPSNPAGVTTWWPRGAVEVADSPGQGAPSWVLIRDNGKTFISPIDPNMQVERTTVQEPADYVAPGTTVEWVAGSSGGTVRVSAVNNAGPKVRSLTFSGSVVSAPVVVGEGLYVLTSDGQSTFVRHFVLSNDGIDQSQPLVLDGVTEIAATGTDHVWVQGRQKLYEVITTGNALREGSAVDWSGDIYGPTGTNPATDDLWAYDGSRLIDLTPASLRSCVSCAEGYRINVAGRPAAVSSADEGSFDSGSLFVAVSQASTGSQQAGINTGIGYYSASDVQGDGSGPTDTLFGIEVTSLVADGAGGVDYVDDLGRLQHWDPQVTAAAR